MPAPRNNKNAAGRRVSRERITLTLGISEMNGLLPLFREYLSLQGIPDTDGNIQQLARDWAYLYWGERLKREIEMSDGAIIL